MSHCLQLVLGILSQDIRRPAVAELAASSQIQFSRRPAVGSRKGQVQHCRLYCPLNMVPDVNAGAGK